MTMRLTLAIAQDCGPTECKAQLLDSGGVILTGYTAQVLNRVRTQPGQLVAIDLTPKRPEVVYRWHSGKVRELRGNRIIIDDQHCNLIDAVNAPWLTLSPQLDDWVFVTSGYSNGWEVADLAIEGRPVHIENLSRYGFPKIEQLYGSKTRNI